jgi:hypothetical protein
MRIHNISKEIHSTTTTKHFYSQASWGRLGMKPHEPKRKRYKTRAKKKGKTKGDKKTKSKKKRKDNKTLS